jgi:hypothetical protein
LLTKVLKTHFLGFDSICQLLSQTVIAFWINTTPALSQFDFDFGILAIFDKVCISF